MHSEDMRRAMFTMPEVRRIGKKSPSKVVGRTEAMHGRSHGSFMM